MDSVHHLSAFGIGGRSLPVALYTLGWTLEAAPYRPLPGFSNEGAERWMCKKLFLLGGGQKD